MQWGTGTKNSVTHQLGKRSKPGSFGRRATLINTAAHIGQPNNYLNAHWDQRHFNRVLHSGTQEGTPSLHTVCHEKQSHDFQCPKCDSLTVIISDVVSNGLQITIILFSFKRVSEYTECSWCFFLNPPSPTLWFEGSVTPGTKKLAQSNVTLEQKPKWSCTEDKNWTKSSLRRRSHY